MNYYDILEISQNASPEVIQNAYKTLAKKYHPDVYQGDKSEAEERMKLINEAYNILSDPQSRMEYDRQLKNEQSNSDSFSQKENNTLDERQTSSAEQPVVKNKRKKPFFIISWGFITLLMFLAIMFEAKWIFWVSIALGCGRFIANKIEPTYKTRGFSRVISIGIVGFMVLSCYIMLFDNTTGIQTVDTAAKSESIAATESNKTDYSETDFDNTPTETAISLQNDILQDSTEHPETASTVSEDTDITDSSNQTMQETEEDDVLPIILNRDFGYIYSYADKYNIKLCHE